MEIINDLEAEKTNPKQSQFKANFGLKLALRIGFPLWPQRTPRSKRLFVKIRGQIGKDFEKEQSQKDRF